MNRIQYFLCTVLLLVGCSGKVNVDEVLHQLKDQQMKAIIKIDGRNFYPNESIFEGIIEANANTLRLNIFDQFESNIILSISGDNWYKIKPVKKQVLIDNQLPASVMIGKVKDPVKRTGEGYLMTEGEITVENFSKEQCIIRFSGKIGKYEWIRVPQKWQRLEGIIIAKKPAVRLQNLSEQEGYF